MSEPNQHNKPGAQPHIPKGGRGAFISRNTAIFSFVGAVTAYYIYSRNQKLPHIPAVTSGAANIEHAFTRGGGAPTHTPAQASPLGRGDLVKGAQEGEKGIGSKTWQDTHGEARPPKTGIEAKFNKSMGGNENRHSG